MSKKNSLFSKPKSKRLSNIISIKSPSAFKESIRKVQKGGVTSAEKRALVLAQNRARVQLHRKNLSKREVKQFASIVSMKLPRTTKK